MSRAGASDSGSVSAVGRRRGGHRVDGRRRLRRVDGRARRGSRRDSEGISPLAAAPLMCAGSRRSARSGPARRGWETSWRSRGSAVSATSPSSSRAAQGSARWPSRVDGRRRRSRRSSGRTRTSTATRRTSAGAAGDGGGRGRPRHGAEREGHLGGVGGLGATARCHRRGLGREARRLRRSSCCTARRSAAGSGTGRPTSSTPSAQHAHRGRDAGRSFSARAGDRGVRRMMKATVRFRAVLTMQ